VAGRGGAARCRGIGQFLAQVAHGLPDVLGDLTGNIPDRRGDLVLELAEVIGAVAEFLPALVGDPVDLAPVGFVVGDQALFLEPGQPRVDGPGGGGVDAHEPVLEQPDHLIPVAG
jgi:hypothetical protein